MAPLAPALPPEHTSLEEAVIQRYSRLRVYARLRPKRLKPRRGRIADPAYRAWIRSLPCMVANRDCRGGTDPNHVGQYGQARANDRNAVPLCRRHHDLYHEIHRRAFEERFGVSFAAAIQGLNEEYELSKGRRVA